VVALLLLVILIAVLVGVTRRPFVLPGQVMAEITFYGPNDNCLPGRAIKHPVRHTQVSLSQDHSHLITRAETDKYFQAGGLGTYDDPITFAGVQYLIPAGTILYYPELKKYFIMEDDCEECRKDWEAQQSWHMDLWMGCDLVISELWMMLAQMLAQTRCSWQTLGL
jgi:hypothetical protein